MSDPCDYIISRRGNSHQPKVSSSSNYLCNIVTSMFRLKLFRLHETYADHISIKEMLQGYSNVAKMSYQESISSNKQSFVAARHAFNGNGMTALIGRRHGQAGLSLAGRVMTSQVNIAILQSCDVLVARNRN